MSIDTNGEDDESDPVALYNKLTERPDQPDPYAEAVAKERRRLEARETAEFWQSVFADPTGRREMWRLFTSCGSFRNDFPFSPNGAANPEAREFSRGKASVGMALYMARQVDCWDGLLLMHTEHDERMKVDE